jgi:hypothetical protein
LLPEPLAVITIVLVMRVLFAMEVGTVNARVKVKRAPEASVAVHDRVLVSSIGFRPLCPGDVGS